MVEEFEERMNMKQVASKLFYSLWKDNTNERKYFITNDYNFIDSFYADDDEEAKEKFVERVWK